MIKSWKLLTILPKSSILDVWLDFEYTFASTQPHSSELVRS